METVLQTYTALLLGGFLLGLGLTTAAPPAQKKKAPVAVRKAAPRARQSTVAKSRAKTTYARSRGRGPQPVPQRRYRGQQTPSQERFNEIQQALVARGFLTTPPTGVWDKDSIDAMKRFQAEQNLPPNGKVTSLSLIALGLGPKRNTSITALR
ncbi:MAG: peptidoglycan-binding protein [Acidobacteria bacterium]|nr:peptidoglycan-binding protein [Acidobacteriota bacterium]